MYGDNDNIRLFLLRFICEYMFLRPENLYKMLTHLCYNVMQAIKGP